LGEGWGEGNYFSIKTKGAFMRLLYLHRRLMADFFKPCVSLVNLKN